MIAITRQPIAFAVHPSLGVKSVAELVAYASKNPGLGFASSGVGSNQHVLGAWFAKEAKINLQHIPYRGAGQAITDLVSGSVKFGILGPAALLPHARTGATSDIATYERGAMLIRETTNTTSPLAMLPERAGHRPPVLTSSLGRAYLSLCDKPERDSILAVLSARGHRERRYARDRGAIAQMVQSTRARGYAVREGGRAPGTTSIAVPVMNNGKIVAAINIICVASAIALDEIVKRYLAPMRRAVREIEASLRIA